MRCLQTKLWRSHRSLEGHLVRQIYFTLSFLLSELFVTGKRKRSAESPVLDETSLNEVVVKPLEIGKSLNIQIMLI